MTNTNSDKRQVANDKLPFQNVSKFSGNKGGFGNVKGQSFSPMAKVVLPPIRITQNKGGGGK